MTIEQAIETVDSLKRNTYTAEDKVSWLQRLESQIYRQVVLTHENTENFVAPDYDAAPLNTVLMAQAPFDQMYLSYLEAQIDYYNGEITLYNEAITMFNAAYSDFESWYNRTHMPIQAASIWYF